jgi:hypothetical protein
MSLAKVLDVRFEPSTELANAKHVRLDEHDGNVLPCLPERLS